MITQLRLFHSSHKLCPPFSLANFFLHKRSTCRKSEIRKIGKIGRGDKVKELTRRRNRTTHQIDQHRCISRRSKRVRGRKVDVAKENVFHRRSFTVVPAGSTHSDFYTSWKRGKGTSSVLFLRSFDHRSGDLRSGDYVTLILLRINDIPGFRLGPSRMVYGGEIYTGKFFAIQTGVIGSANKGSSLIYRVFYFN